MKNTMITYPIQHTVAKDLQILQSAIVPSSVTISRKGHQACSNCNKLHKKCDGIKPHPCSRCTKKGIECIYLPPKKRGPKTGSKITKKRKTKTHQEINFPNSQEIYLQFNSILFHFIDFYTDVYKIQNLVNKESLKNIVTGKQVSQISSEQFLLFSVLTMSAQHIGDRKHAREFFQRARHLSGFMFDQIDYSTACAMSLLSLYCCTEADQQRASIFNKNACEIIENLNLNVESYLYRTCYYVSILIFIAKIMHQSNHLVVGDIREDKLKELVLTPSYDANYALMSHHVRNGEQMIQLKIEGLSESTIIPILLKYNLDVMIQKDLNYNSILSKLDLIDSYVESSEYYKISFVDKVIIQFCIYATRVHVLSNCGHEYLPLATIYAQKASELTRNTYFNLCTPIVICFFPYVVNFCLRMNYRDLLLMNYQALENISRKFIIAAIAADSLKMILENPPPQIMDQPQIMNHEITNDIMKQTENVHENIADFFL